MKKSIVLYHHLSRFISIKLPPKDDMHAFLLCASCIYNIHIYKSTKKKNNYYHFREREVGEREGGGFSLSLLATTHHHHLVLQEKFHCQKLKFENSSQWKHSTCTKIPHKCKKRASCVGLTMPGMWAPSVFIKLATSTYLF